MKKTALVLQILLGLPFLVFGLNHLFQFLPEQEPDSPAAQAFVSALTATGYMLPLIAGVEAVCGLLLVTGQFVPFALVVLAPVMVNIIAFHWNLERQGIEIALVLLALHLLLAAIYGKSFQGLMARSPKLPGE